MKRKDGLPLSFTSSLPFLHLHKGDNSIEPKCFTALQASLGAHQSTSEVVEVVLMNQQINQMTDLQSQQMSKGHQRPLSKSLEIQECSKTLRWEWCRVSAVVEHAGCSRFLRNLTIRGQMNKGANVPN